MSPIYVPGLFPALYDPLSALKTDLLYPAGAVPSSVSLSLSLCTRFRRESESVSPRYNSSEFDCGLQALCVCMLGVWECSRQCVLDSDPLGSYHYQLPLLPFSCIVCTLFSVTYSHSNSKKGGGEWSVWAIWGRDGISDRFGVKIALTVNRSFCGNIICL